MTILLKNEIEGFKTIYRKEFWIDISDSEAEYMGRKLVNLSKLALYHNSHSSES